MHKITDDRPDHNSGCTDLIQAPFFDLKTFPYVLVRNRFKVDLVDVKNFTIHTITSEMNTQNMYPKLIVMADPFEKKMELFFSCQAGNKRMIRSYEMDKTLVNGMQ
jgi:hypothetical protein